MREPFLQKWFPQIKTALVFIKSFLSKNIILIFINVVKILVTGGSGFLGRHVIRELLRVGHRDIVMFNRGACDDFLDFGTKCIRGDISSYLDVNEACDECDAVIHVAAKAGIHGPYNEYFEANVIGTRNVIRACRANGVKYLVHISTPSVVFDGKSISNVNEKAPYGTNFLCHYAKTKAIAEKEVLSANGKDGLLTVALRPHLIWGPGDNHLIPNIISAAKAGKLKQVGDGKNWVGITYVENAALAVNLALKALTNNKADGKAYFIAQEEPVQLWPWINSLLEKLNLPIVTKKIPYKAAYAIGASCELLYKIFNINSQPPMTRFLAVELAKDHYFDISAAKMDLSYIPKISIEEGMDILKNSFKTA